MIGFFCSTLMIPPFHETNSLVRTLQYEEDGLNSEGGAQGDVSKNPVTA